LLGKDLPVALFSVPFETRLRLAREPRALTAVGRIVVQEVFRWQRERAGLWTSRRSRSTSRCESSHGYVAAGSSSTSEAGSSDPQAEI